MHAGTIPTHIKLKLNWSWWLMPLIPGLGRQRQADLYESEGSVVNIVSSRTARAKDFAFKKGIS